MSYPTQYWWVTYRLLTSTPPYNSPQWHLLAMFGQWGFFYSEWYVNSVVDLGCLIKWTLSRNSVNSQLKLAVSHKVPICINMNHVTWVFISSSSSSVIFWTEMLSKEFVKITKIRQRGPWQHHCIVRCTKKIISDHHLSSRWGESLNDAQQKCEIKCDFAVHRIEVPHQETLVQLSKCQLLIMMTSAPSSLEMCTEPKSLNSILRLWVDMLC